MNWSRIASLALKLGGLIIPAVAKVEKLAKIVGTLRGSAKQDRAVEIIHEAADGLLDTSDWTPEFDALVREGIDFAVALHNYTQKSHASEGEL